MQSKLNPYISFKETPVKLWNFIARSLAANLISARLKNFTLSRCDEDNLVMHSVLEADNGITIMASDTPNRMQNHSGTNMSISLTGDNEAELKAYFEKLSAGGTVTMPLEKAMWGDSFGMCIDKFGVQWLVNISGQKA